MFGSTFIYCCKFAEKCKRMCFFSHCFISLSFINSLNVWKRVETSSTDHSVALGTFHFCRSCSLPVDFSSLGPRLALCVSVQGQKQGPFLILSPFPVNASDQVQDMAADRWASRCEYSSMLSSSFSLAVSVPFRQSFRSSHLSLVTLSCRPPQQQNRNCRCYSSSSAE